MCFNNCGIIKVMFLNNIQFTYQVRSYMWFPVSNTSVSSETLCFKKQVKQVVANTKFNLNNLFKKIHLTPEAAKIYFHARIFSHITYSLTTWFLTDTIIKPVPVSVYKEALKALDNQP